MAIDLHAKNEIQWVKEGRVFQAKHGNLTTPQAFETDLVRKTADFAVHVPGSIVIVPLRLTVETEATTNIFQALVWTCDNFIGAALHTAATVVNINPRYSAGMTEAKDSSCTASYLATSTGFAVTPANPVDLLRVYIKADLNAINETPPFEQVIYAPLHGKGAPCIVGSESSYNNFLACVGEGTGTGYITATWAEWTYAEFYAD